MTVAARLALLALVTVTSLITAPTLGTVGWCALLAVAALPDLLAPAHRIAGGVGRIAEVIVAVLAASVIDGPFGATLPYLLVPVFGAALYRSRAQAYALVGLAAVVGGGTVLSGLLVVGTSAAASLTLAVMMVQWITLAAVVALVSGWLRGLLHTPPQPQPYAEATRLLTQLRTVARQLPGGTLDPGGIAAHLLDEVREVVPADRAAVLGGSGAGRLVVLAQSGPERVDWETSLDADTPVADAWATQQSQTADRSVARSLANLPQDTNAVSTLVVPLVAGMRTVGLILAEADHAGAYPPDRVDGVAALATPAALRLEAALLFDDVRSLATTEERQRLAREIHDGVAQELVMVGYGIDNALGALPDDVTAAEELRTLRAEVTRVITELRLSLFELRSEVDRHGGLGSAIADYSRTVGTTAGLRVHLSLDESTARLPAAVEAELLRIAQEAITNARKHARAENLWITCEVDPPYARVEVTDDGQGLGDALPDGRYGLAIMAERAARIRGRLDIRERAPHGTIVTVVLGRPLRHGSVAAPEGVDGDDEPEHGRAHQGSAGR